MLNPKYLPIEESVDILDPTYLPVKESVDILLILFERSEFLIDTSQQKIPSACVFLCVFD